MKLYPFEECATEAEKRMHDGATVYQQFNCAHCGAKQTIGTPNTFHEKGICEQCDSVTDIKKDGCNYMLILGRIPHE